MADLYQQNLKTLRAVDPELAKFVLDRESDPYPSVEPAKKGGLTVKLGNVYVHSKYAPEAEAQKWTRGEVAPIHVHFGFGLGYGAMVDQPADDGTIVIYEPFPALFLAAMHHCDLRACFADKNIRIRFQIEDIVALLVRLPGKDSRIGIRISPFHAKAAPQPWRALQQAIESVIIRRASAMETLRRSTKAFTESCLRATVELLHTPNINSLRGQYRGLAAVVVAAGPSLDRNLAQLRALQNKAVIICISRSAKPLERHGIRPDFLLHNEAQDYLHLIHDCTNLQQTAFVLDSQVHLKFARYPAQARFLYHATVNFAVPWLAQVLPNYQAAPLETAGSVANEAFSFAHFLGCDPVIVIGQDLALTGGAYYAQAPDNQAFTHAANAIVPIDGYFGRPLQTFATYKSFAAWFAEQGQLLRKQQRAEFINATEGGAYLAGFRQQKLAQTVQQLRDRPDKPTKLALERWQAHRHRVSTETYRAFLQHAIVDLKKLVAYNTQFQAIQRSLSWPPAAQQWQQLTKLETSMQQLIRKHGVISGYIQAELQDLQDQQKPSEDPQLQLRQRGQSYAVISEGARACSETLDALIPQLDKRQMGNK